jgi:hypothetical protein
MKKRWFDPTLLGAVVVIVATSVGLGTRVRAASVTRADGHDQLLALFSE